MLPRFFSRRVISGAGREQNPEGTSGEVPGRSTLESFAGDAINVVESRSASPIFLIIYFVPFVLVSGHDRSIVGREVLARDGLDVLRRDLLIQSEELVDGSGVRSQANVLRQSARDRR